MPKFIVKIVFNPLIWVGIFLSYLTLQKTSNAEHIILMLKNTKYYTGLFLGSFIYVLLFEKHYTKKREKIAILPTFVAILDTMFTIFITKTTRMKMKLRYLIYIPVW